MKYKTMRKISAYISASLLIAACTADPVAENYTIAKKADLSLNTNEIRVPYDATSATFTVSSNSDWFVEALPGSWVESYTMSGKKEDTSLELSFYANPSETDDRECSFEVVSVQDENKRVTFTLKQAPHKYFLVDKTSIAAPAAGGEYFIDITSNVSWRVEASKGLQLSSTTGIGTASVKLTVPVSSSFDEKNFEVKVITDEEVIFGQQGETKLISITQEAAEATFVVSPLEINVDAEDTEAKFTVFENVGYSITDGEGVTHTIEEGAAGHEITLHFPANTTASPVEYTCTVSTSYVAAGIQPSYTVTVKQARVVPDAVVDFSQSVWPFEEAYITVTNQKKLEVHCMTYTLKGTPYKFDLKFGDTIMDGKTSISTYDWKTTYTSMNLTNNSDGTEYIQATCPEDLQIASVEVFLGNSSAVAGSVTNLDGTETVWSGNLPGSSSSKMVDLTSSSSAKYGCRIHFTKAKTQYKIVKIIVKYKVR